MVQGVQAGEEGEVRALEEPGVQEIVKVQERVEEREKLLMVEQCLLVWEARKGGHEVSVIL